VAGDALDALGCAKSNRYNWLLKLDADEKGKNPVITRGGTQQMLTVTKSCLLTLIMRSDKPVAVAFQNWVTRVVLPAIEKTGGYLLNEEARDTAKADDRQAMLLPELLLKHALPTPQAGFERALVVLCHNRLYLPP
jgi:prophage antirepressor-like protein